jgi:hypothetical protein
MTTGSSGSGVTQVIRLLLGALFGAVATVERGLGRAPGTSPIWDVLVGAGVVAADGATAVSRAGVAVVRPVAVVVLHPPLLRQDWQPARVIDALAKRGRQERISGDYDVERLIDTLIPLVLDRVLEQADLTAVVKAHVDIDALVAEVDLDAIAARIDVDAVARRLDLDAVMARVPIETVVALAEQVVDAIDLPGIVRDSTGSIASEAVLDVRMTSIEADQAISRIVDRLLLRRRKRATDAPGEPPSAASAEPIAVSEELALTESVVVLPATATDAQVPAQREPRDPEDAR